MRSERIDLQASCRSVHHRLNLQHRTMAVIAWPAANPIAESIRPHATPPECLLQANRVMHSAKLGA